MDQTQAAPAATADEIKIIEVCDSEWWTGRTVAEAVTAATAHYYRPGIAGHLASRFRDARELPADDLAGYLIYCEHDGTTRTFADELALRVAAGDPAPRFFCRDW